MSTGNWQENWQKNCNYSEPIRRIFESGSEQLQKFNSCKVYNESIYPASDFGSFNGVCLCHIWRDTIIRDGDRNCGADLKSSSVYV